MNPSIYSTVLVIHNCISVFDILKPYQGKHPSPQLVKVLT